MKTPRTLAQLKADPRVAEVWQEHDGYGEEHNAHLPSWWVSLADGWADTEGRCLGMTSEQLRDNYNPDHWRHDIHTKTIKEACIKLRDSVTWVGSKERQS